MDHSTPTPPSSFQLHIQLPNTYRHHQHPSHHYYNTPPVGTPTTPDSVGHGFFSGDESPSESRKAREMAPFLRNLRNMLDRESPEVLRWNKDGTAFEIHDMDEMMNTVLPKYFKHKKYTSFQRQLNYFNFKKWTKSRANVCTFSNELFTRHEPHRSTYITRKKSMSGKDMAAASDDSADESRRGYDSPCSSACDSPVQRKDHLSRVDMSFQSMSLHKPTSSRMTSPYENKHLTRVMGSAGVRRKPRMEVHVVEDIQWLDNDLDSLRDSMTSVASSATSVGGEWDDNELNWGDWFPYSDAQLYDNQYTHHPHHSTSMASTSSQPLRGGLPNNQVTFFAAI
ncbi:unnamed protein product [Aphanomyces euteiches]|uniref:HSF-type DNA-binding domain-containing protein n=2 Tax=Aphanomyces euteiches TaxID=100861 RepID=A0A6G0WXW4_9STRA|nr:hypothetical protein Ae201684_010629 [Aphanomyces euteiches]KAH9090024.1 hypothetical protein Ae201684P_014779 [Aphanomyces euteiches]KAH9141110.1 hypothetical protein AeRB84_014682 [Aphanomyces euteiches]